MVLGRGLSPVYIYKYVAGASLVIDFLQYQCLLRGLEDQSPNSAYGQNVHTPSDEYLRLVRAEVCVSKRKQGVMDHNDCLPFWATPD